MFTVVRLALLILLLGAGLTIQHLLGGGTIQQLSGDASLLANSDLIIKGAFGGLLTEISAIGTREKRNGNKPPRDVRDRP